MAIIIAAATADIAMIATAISCVCFEVVAILSHFADLLFILLFI
jgi:hypothetical protein